MTAITDAVVIIPAYNPGSYLTETLKSVFCQSYQGAYRIALVDDGSTEDLSSVLARAANEYGRPNVSYQFISRQSNGGVASARNAGISNTIEKIVFFLDADDLMHPHRMEQSMRHFNADPDLMFLCGNFQSIIEGKIVGTPHFHNPCPLDYYNLLIDYPVACGTVALRRQALERTGLFNESYEVMEDYDLWARFFKEFPRQIKYIHEVFYYYRRHSNDCLKSLSRKYFWTERHLEILKEMMVKYRFFV